MNVALEITGYNRERAMRQMRTIYHNLARIYEIAERDGIPTYKAADRMAEERIVVMGRLRSEEHTSELQSLMRISYAVFCLKQKKHNKKQNIHIQQTTTSRVSR